MAVAYDYSPYGQVASTGNLTQPVQWSSEMNDEELEMIYYNYRHYNPADGRWINRDSIAEQGGWNLYGFVKNNPLIYKDNLGNKIIIISSLPEWDVINFEIYNKIIQGMKNTLKRWEESKNGSPISVKMINQYLGKWEVTVDGKSYKGSAEELISKIKREGESSYNNYTTKKDTVAAVNKALEELKNGEKYDKIVILTHGHKETGISLFADQDTIHKEDPIFGEWRKNELIKVVSCYQNEGKNPVRENLISFKIDQSIKNPCHYKFIPTKTETSDA